MMLASYSVTVDCGLYWTVDCGCMLFQPWIKFWIYIVFFETSKNMKPIYPTIGLCYVNVMSNV